MPQLRKIVMAPSRAKRIVIIVFLHVLVPGIVAAESVAGWQGKVAKWKGSSGDPCDHGMSLLGVPYQTGGGMYGGLRADSEYVQTYDAARANYSPIAQQAAGLDSKISNAQFKVDAREKEIKDLDG